MKAAAAAAVPPVLGLSACGTGVDDEKGGQGAQAGYPCAELIDFAEGLPTVDCVKVGDDPRRAGR